MSQFAELLAQLQAEQEQSEALAKSVPAEGGKDDDAIQAAAAEAGEPDADDNNPEDDVDDVAPVAKSVMADDGQEYVDATDMLKSLEARIAEHDDVLSKAMAGTLDVVKSLKATIESQGSMIKSMQDKLVKLAGGGAGRKAVLSVVEKPAAGETMAKSQQEEGLTPAQVLAKANEAFDAKKITGQELVALDVALRSGALPDQAVLAKALA